MQGPNKPQQPAARQPQPAARPPQPAARPPQPAAKPASPAQAGTPQARKAAQAQAYAALQQAANDPKATAAEKLQKIKSQKALLAAQQARKQSREQIYVAPLPGHSTSGLETVEKSELRKEKDSTNVFILAFILILILLLAGIGFCYAANVGGMQSAVTNSFITADADYKSSMKELMTLKDEYDGKAQQLNEQKQQIELQKQQIEQDSQKAQDELDELQQQMDQIDEEYNSLYRTVYDHEKTISILEAMDTAQTAQVLQDLGDIKLAATILAGMDANRASKIIEQMQPAFAADIAALMIMQ